MSIAGNLRTMAFADLVQWLSASEKSGTLVIEGPRCTKKVYLRRGALAAVASDHPREMLGYYLVGWGLMTEEQLEQAIALQDESRLMLGELAVKLGFVTFDEMAYLIRVRTEETIYDLIAWDEGEFRFLEGELPERDALDVELSMHSLLLEGFRQRDERRRMRSVIQDTRHVPVPSPGAELNPTTDEERDIVAVMDGRRTVEEIALACRLPGFAVLSFVFEATRRGQVEVAPPPPEPAAMPGASHAPWHGAVAEIRDRLERDRLLDALRLLSGLVDRFGGDPHLVAVAMRIEGEIEQRLDAKAFEPSAMLELTVDLRELVKLECDPAEGFVLSRITGRYTVQEVLSQLPGSPLQNRVILQNLLRRGLIRTRQSTGMARYRATPTGSRDRGDDDPSRVKS
jgi:hypothetical protein